MSGKSKQPADFSSPALARLGAVFFVATLATYLTSSIYSPSFYEHLTIGNWILAHGAVPQQEHWASATSGQPWRSTSWAFELLLAGTETLFGETGHLLLKLALVAGVITCSFLVYARWARNVFVAAAVATIACCGALMSAELEPGLAALGLFLLTLHLALCFRKSPSRRLLVFAAATMALYANIHRSFVICLLGVVVLLWGAKSSSGGETSSPAKSAEPGRALFCLVLLCAALVSPYFGAHIRQALLECFNFCYLEVNLRLHPGTIYSFPIAFLLLLLVIFSLVWHLSPDSLELREAVAVGAGAVAAFGSELLAPYALLSAGLGISLAWGRGAAADSSNLGQAIAALKSKLSRFPAAGVLWVLLCLIIVNSTRLWRTPRNAAFLPVREIDYLLEKGEALPLLHELQIGSYLLYRFARGDGSARFPVVISQRAALSDRRAAVEQLLFDRLAPGWRRYFDRIGAGAVICRGDSALFSVLAVDPGWTLEMAAGKVLSTEGSQPESFADVPRVSWALFLRK